MTTPTPSPDLAQLSADVANATARLHNSSISVWSPSFILWLTGMLCAFCLVFFLVSSYVAMRSGEGLSERYFKLTAVTLIAALASLITMAGYSAEQSNAALGLLGTIAGYLLGKETSKKKRASEDEREV